MRPGGGSRRVFPSFSLLLPVDFARMPAGLFRGNYTGDRALVVMMKDATVFPGVSD